MQKISGRLLIVLFALGDGCATAAQPFPRPLDLTPLNFSSAHWQERLQRSVPDEGTELPTQAVVVTHAQPQRWHTHISTLGLGALFWAAFNPSQAWRILLPLESGNDFSTEPAAHVANCTTTGAVASHLANCP